MSNLCSKKNMETEPKCQDQEEEHNNNPDQSSQNLPKHHNIDPIVFKSRMIYENNITNNLFELFLL